MPKKYLKKLEKMLMAKHCYKKIQDSEKLIRKN